MKEIKLSDQLGAMAIIDELYQQQQILLEHLDRDLLRSKLTQKIKDYYQARGNLVDDKIIDEGVSQWLENRLSFTVPKRSWLQHTLIFIYIKRTYWLSALALLCLLFILLFTYSRYTNQQQTKDIATTYQHIKDVNQQITTLENEIDVLNKTAINFAQVPVKKLNADIKEILTQKIVLPVIDINSPLSDNQFNVLQTTSNDAEVKLNNLTAKISQLKNLINDDHKLATLINSDNFSKAAKRYPVLQVTIDNTIDNLKTGATTIDLNKIETLYSSTERATNLKQKIENDRNVLNQLKVPSGDLTAVLSLQTALNTDLTNLNFDNVANYQQMISYYIQLAQTELTFTIVDRPNIKSGIERTHENTNGRSWYLIVEPVTANGNNHPVWIRSIETGESKLVSIFGVQVTQTAFNAVRNDKSDDGHIDNNRLCYKPIGRLEFSCPDSVKSGKILEW